MNRNWEETEERKEEKNLLLAHFLSMLMKEKKSIQLYNPKTLNVLLAKVVQTLLLTLELLLLLNQEQMVEDVLTKWR